MSVLCIDLDTSGLIDYRAELSAGHQPQIVAIACGIYEDDGTETDIVFSALIRPEGFSIPESAVKIHGIDQRRAVRYGIPLKTALSVVMNMAALAPTCISYGLESYDAKVMRAALSHFGSSAAFPPIGVDAVCVKTLATEICKIEGEGSRYQRPDLETAAKVILQRPLARTTLSNMRATADIYFALKKMGVAA